MDSRVLTMTTVVRGAKRVLKREGMRVLAMAMRRSEKAYVKS